MRIVWFNKNGSEFSLDLQEVSKFLHVLKTFFRHKKLEKVLENTVKLILHRTVMGVKNIRCIMRI